VDLVQWRGARLDHTTSGVLRIDLDAVVSNYRQVQGVVAPARTAAVVKADGYGLGADRIAPALYRAGCRDFFVAHLREGMALRPDLPGDAAIYILNGLLPGAEADCAASGLIPVLNAIDQVRRWAATARDRQARLPAVLQMDSGMSRLGLAPMDVAQLHGAPEELHDIDLLFIMSHLACASQPDHSFNAQQRATFSVLAACFPDVPRCLDNSGGSLMAHVGHGDLVRPGIALYGGAPHAPPSPMRPVVSLDSAILQLRTVSPGSGVGYDLSYRTARETHIATIPVGYADGWPRALGNRGAAFVGGRRAPIIGHISMDSITLDVTDVPDPLLYPGAPVELIGPHQSLDDVARHAGTISYEILTGLGHRFEREYLPVRMSAPAREDAA